MDDDLNVSAALAAVFSIVRRINRLLQTGELHREDAMQLIEAFRQVDRVLDIFDFQKVLPLIGRFFSQHHFAYSYLPDSVSRFPAPDTFMDLMKSAGFSHITCHRLTLGVANLFVGIKV